jgi:hypothetical protein
MMPNRAKKSTAAHREIVKVRLDFVRHRAWQVCIGLQSRELDALQMCEILLHRVRATGAHDRISSLVEDCNNSEAL